MAMGGGLISRKGNGNGQRGRPYGLMLLLAFGAALVGVMALHKLRERRIFNLLLEEKNRRLNSFQLLLQKEREYTKEMKRKAEETKAKIYSLRNQKMKLDRRLLEMQSTIDSLKDEQKTMESELEEKQNEIKLLRDKDMDSGNENPQVIALTAALKQKEAEIEDLKHRLKSSVRVLSVSTDDPSNPPPNITIIGSMEQKQKIESSNKGGDNSTKAEDGNETKSIFPRKEDNSEGVEDGTEKKGESETKNMTGEGQLQKLESLGENAGKEGDGREVKNEYDSKHADTSKIDGANATDTIDDMGEQEKKSSLITGQLKRPKNPHQQGGDLLGIDENSRVSRLLGRFGLLRRTKGKRWRIPARNRFSKKNVNSEIDHTKANFFKHQSNEDMIQRKMSRETNQGENAMPRNHEISLVRIIPENTGANGEASNYTHDAKRLQVEETVDIKQNMNSRDVKEPEKKAELSSADRDEQEPETEAANGDLSGDFMSDSEDKVGNKEETDESEF